MDKVIYSHDNDALLQRAGGVMAFLFESGRQVKSAASSAFSEKLLRQHMPDDNHFGVHLIAMGASENYGFNKNGDHWARNDLKARHDTFVKCGHFFVEHRNRDPKLAIGKVAASGYNDEMDRVELVVHGCKKKASEQHERAKRGEALGFSMSARVSHDICSCCEAMAKSARLYCTHLAQRMTQFVPEFQKFAYARNPNPTFFDISDVRNPADRIAWYLDYMLDKEQAKSASENFPFSNLVAERIGVGLPAERGWSTSQGQALLEKLAAEEAYVEEVLRHGGRIHGQTKPAGNLIWADQRSAFVKEAMPFMTTGDEISDVQLEQFRKVSPDVLFHHLTKRAAILPFPVFYALVQGGSLQEASTSAVCKAADQNLPTIFRDLQKIAADAELEQMFTPASLFKTACECGPGDPVQSMFDQVSQKLSMQPAQVRLRAVQNCAGASLDKNASAVSEKFPNEVMEKAAVVSRAYATYKVAQLVHLTDHNLIDDPVVPLLFCHHKR